MHGRGSERIPAAPGGLHKADAALALLLMAIVGMMIIPLPTALLDLLIAGNVALALVMLLIAMVIPDGLAFTAMPTVLLVTTLYRLALNVSSTRLILLQADAGDVIRSFGEFVVRGDYIVGAVIFLILTLIQYVVVARGSERVAEVGARFNLDAMPGKQMAIDADLRSGSTTPQAARIRREALQRESQFYGAMDGAMKFVKGDAIAGIAITTINIVAGMGIGVGVQGLGLRESLQLYGLLTIGDGLVSQIPSLLISTSAGLVVTRVASADGARSLGSDVMAQLFDDPRVLALGAGFLVFLALVPGLPALPFAALGAVMATGAFGLVATRRRRRAGETRISRSAPGATPDLALLSVALGDDLAHRLEVPERPLDAALEALSQKLFRNLGLPLPAVHVEREPALQADAYELRIVEIPLGQGRVEGDDPGAAAQELVAHLERLVRAHACELLGMQETQSLLDQLERSEPALVRHLVPKPVSLELLTEVLRRLLAEGVSVRQLRQILEALGARAGAQPDLEARVEAVRAALSRQITYQHARGGVLAAHPVDPMVEDLVRDAVREGHQGRYLALAPDRASAVVEAIRRALGSQDASGHEAEPGAVLLCQADVRPFLRQLLRSELPGLAVMSYDEVAPEARVERRAAVEAA